MTKLDKDFEEILKEILPQIKKHLEAADNSVGEAIKLSEKHGIPFVWNPFPGDYNTDRSYTPENFKSSHKIDNTLSKNNIHLDEYGEKGWQFWNTSSLTC